MHKPRASSILTSTIPIMKSSISTAPIIAACATTRATYGPTLEQVMLLELRRMTAFLQLTPVIVNALVEKIVVHQVQGVGKNKMQRLDIYYNFVGVLDMPGIGALPQSVTVDTRQGVAVEYITRKAG